LLKRSKKSKKEAVVISVSSDRTVYPLNSKVYLRVKLNAILVQQFIFVEVYGPNRRFLFSEMIDPETYDDLELKREGIFQVSLSMKGLHWKVGKKYTVKARHGLAEAKTTFTIDERKPVIQTDQSVYSWSDDVVITVIDPDADKDVFKAEFIGAQPNSRLTISSSKGKIRKYLLQETGESTGIFQGVLGFIGVTDDGKIVPKRYGKKLIKKTQGVGIEDGFIEVLERDELKISYITRAGKTTLSAFVVKEEDIMSEKIAGLSKSPSVKQKNVVRILKGSSVPHNEKLLDPSVLWIKVRERVRWINEDNAAHTITSGTQDKGPDGLFDSSLFMSGSTFEVSFDKKGNYDYFDMVHPWITGEIIVK